MNQKFQNELDHCMDSPSSETSEPNPKVSEVATSDPSPSISSFEEPSGHHQVEEEFISTRNREVEISDIIILSSNSNLSRTSREMTFFEKISVSTYLRIHSNGENETSPLMTGEAFYE